MPKSKKGVSMAEEKKNWVKLCVILAVLVGVIVLMRVLGITKYISIKNIQKLNEWINSFGALGPVIYVVMYILSCVFFLPGIPITMLGAVAFGAVKGTILVSIGSTLGATASFLIARYAARSMVEGWIQKNERLRKIDEGVRKHGWRMLMITRLVPIFPFNVQNYVYGITNISLGTYVFVSWICMLPGTIAYVFAGGALISGKGDIKKTIMYLAIAGVFFVLVSLIPGMIKKRYKDVVEE